MQREPTPRLEPVRRSRPVASHRTSLPRSATLLKEEIAGRRHLRVRPLNEGVSGQCLQLNCLDASRDW